ncbi:MAG: hypothetical protein IKL07_10300 [Clostridium sp.]|nr:hypothetical protein [Clostridium sp.]
MNQVEGIQIREIATYHPETVRDNDYFEEAFGGKGFLARMISEDTLGRDKRFVIKPGSDENALTLGIEASKRVLEKAGLKGSDVDMICFCSFTPEYVTPPSSLIIHNEIGGKDTAFCYDMNVNCAGMLFAVEQLSKYMAASTGYNRVLVVAAEALTKMFAPDDIFNQVCFGDCGCALILEKTDDKSKIVDTRVYVESDQINLTKSPICGFSNISTAEQKDRYFCFNAPTITSEKSAHVVLDMLKEHNLEVSDVKVFLTSQFTKDIGAVYYDTLGVSEEQKKYIGDRYGYTGANSLFVCMDELLEEGKIERGDYVVLWTVGGSMQYIATLIRY